MPHHYDDRDDLAADAARAYAPQNSLGWGMAAEDYRAATADLDPADRPLFDPTDWRDPMGQPTVPDWARDDQVDPVCPTCVSPHCAGAYGGTCPNARDPYYPNTIMGY